MCEQKITNGTLICVRPGVDHATHVFTASSPGDPEAGYDE